MPTKKAPAFVAYAGSFGLGFLASALATICATGGICGGGFLPMITLVPSMILFPMQVSMLRTDDELERRFYSKTFVGIHLLILITAIGITFYIQINKEMSIQYVNADIWILSFFPVLIWACYFWAALYDLIPRRE